MEYEELMSRALDEFSKLKADFSDVRLVELVGLRIEVADGKIKELRFMEERGLALRCLVSGGWGFTSTSILTQDEVKKSCMQAYKLAKSSSEKAKEKFKIDFKMHGLEVDFKPIENPLDTSIEEKIKMCMEMEKEMRNISGQVKSTSVVYLELTEKCTIVNSLGLRSMYKIPAMYIAATAYASEAGVIQRGYESHGGTGGLEILKEKKPIEIAREAASKAIELLKAKSPPAGKFTCILDPELAGVFIHEAFGHACEADLVLLGGSILEGMIGKQVGSPIITVKDDPTMKGLFGYTPIDSEGVSGSGTILVSRGVLTSYLHSLETASRMNAQPTGNARAQGYGATPLVRMTNTFIDRGEWKPEELFEDVEKGVYAKGSPYGYVDPAKGEFVFKCSQLYVIEKGEVKYLCRDAALSGYTLDVLMKTDAVANDLSFRPGLCGKEDQLVRVTTGAPHIRVKDVLIGGLA